MSVAAREEKFGSVTKREERDGEGEGEADRSGGTNERFEGSDNNRPIPMSLPEIGLDHCIMLHVV